MTDNGDGTCSIALTASSSNSFETIAVPAGASVVAESSTDTLTLTETSFLTITGTAATDTIDITQVTTDLGTDGLIAANAVALGTDTTNAYVADLTAGTYIDVSGGGAETANVTVTVDPTEILDVTFAAGANASQTWTWDLSGTDPQATFGSDALTLNAEDITIQGAGPNILLDPDSGTAYGFHVDPGGAVAWLGQSTTHFFTMTSTPYVEIGATNNLTHIKLLTDGTGDGEVQLPAGSINTEVAGGLQRCAGIGALVATNDNMPLGSFSQAVTITSLWCHCHTNCGTPATITLEDGNANAMTGTATCVVATSNPTPTTITAGGGLVAYEPFQFDVTNSPTASGDYALCVGFTQP